MARNFAGSGVGGGIQVAGVGSVLTLIRSTVRRNVGGEGGGGTQASNTTLTNCAVTGNSSATATDQALGRSRGGFGTKLHLAVDGWATR